MPSLRDRSTRLMIRLAYHGCANRPFFHIVVARNRKPRNGPHLEQIGTYDPMPNIYNEKLVAINFDRLKYYYTNGAQLTKPVEQLLGLCGYLPIHYTTRLQSYKESKRKELARQKKTIEEDSKSVSQSSSS